MNFVDLSVNNRITVTKREFSRVVKSVFENPEMLKSFVNSKNISKDQSKTILKSVDKLNSKTCACCRKFDPTKLNMTPIVEELEPLLDIAQANVRKGNY
jgi:hypothetical protein